MRDPGPEVQNVYWLRTTVLPAGDPEDYRVVVVLAAPASPEGTVAVVTRTGEDAAGVPHPAAPDLGLSAPGQFSRRLPVEAGLWSPSTAVPIGRLDDDTFAAVRARFGR